MCDTNVIMRTIQNKIDTNIIITVLIFLEKWKVELKCCTRVV